MGWKMGYSQKGEKRVFHQNLLCSWEWEHRVRRSYNKQASKLEMRLGKTDLRSGVRDKDLELAYSLSSTIRVVWGFTGSGCWG